MNKIIKILKNNYKIVIGLILGIIISSISVYAVENIAMIDSNEVSYDNTTSHGTKGNVQESIDELYERSGVKTTKWTDPTLNGADPVLKDGLIPVTIDSDGTVRYANLYTEWYNYSEKRWANAVILVSSPSKKYTTGDVILEQDIESYFVWIPRYKYKVWDTGNYTDAISFNNIANIKEDAEGKYAIRKLLGNARIIDVEFGDKETVKIDSTTKDGGGSGAMNVSVGDYILHPAFTLGETKLNGIWVGKFETGYKGAGSKETAEQDSSDSTKIIIKPDVYSWRGATVENFFMSAYNYHREDYNSHMMKNTEWGAAAYLSHSSYGIGTEVNINNNKTHKTGYSSYNVDQSTNPGTESTGEDGKSEKWNTQTGYLASTTGNITGVYDMSGGAMEYIAGYRVNSGENNKSGFNETEITETYNNYIDQYDATSTVTLYNKRILGDATGELGPSFSYTDADDKNRVHNSWYFDYPFFVDVSNPWFVRGGYYLHGIMAGQFSFSRETGGVNTDIGFRVVLSISE